MLEGDADQGLAARHGLGWGCSLFCVLVDVAIERLHVFEGFLFAKDLHHRGKEGIGRAR